MSHDKPQGPREFWLDLTFGQIYSSEKEYDGDAAPDSEKVHLVEASAFETLANQEQQTALVLEDALAQIELLRSEREQDQKTILAWNKRIAQLNVEIEREKRLFSDATDSCRKLQSYAEDMEKQRDEVRGQNELLSVELDERKRTCKDMIQVLPDGTVEPVFKDENLLNEVKLLRAQAEVLVEAIRKSKELTMNATLNEIWDEALAKYESN